MGLFAVVFVFWEEEEEEEEEARQSAYVCIYAEWRERERENIVHRYTERVHREMKNGHNKKKTEARH